MLAKPAVTRQPIIDVIRNRWSPRAFSERPVPPDVMVSLLEAARWAASCNNSQPWRFLVASRDDADGHARLLAGLNEGNQRWAARAPVLMVVCAFQDLPSGRKSAHHWYDCGQAVAQLIAQATSHGLVAHQMAGIQREVLIESCAVPADHDVVCAIALGYPGEVSELPEDLAERERAERVRQPLATMVFTSRFGETLGPAS
ncbi:MAG: nitroreductase family protein [Ectothiorhodospiraceae bacterium]|nr:nitroreductase family protein [Planctomycetota bacterium]MCP5152411.1 nitroreductase family protein [Chromatiales bacterium]MCP5154259.1 nitroreductase family protein [Ectothiorhodospiraceae bacterium]